MLNKNNIKGGEMMIRKKGLSTVVTTLIIVLLVLAAIGIIWGPIQNLLKGGENAVDKTKCLDVDISATKVVNTTTTSYSVTMKRSSSGEGEFGAKIIIFDVNETTNGFVDSGEFFTPLAYKTVNVTGVANGVRLEINPYYIDSNGKEALCQGTTKFGFKL